MQQVLRQRPQKELVLTEKHTKGPSRLRLRVLTYAVAHLSFCSVGLPVGRVRRGALVRPVQRVLGVAKVAGAQQVVPIGQVRRASLFHASF